MQLSGVHVDSRYRAADNVSESRAMRRRENISSQAWSQDQWEGYQGWSAAEWEAWRGVGREGWSAAEWDAWRGVSRD